MAILSFNDTQAEYLFINGNLPLKGVRWHQLKSIVSRKLDAMQAAKDLKDLRVIPGNHLEKLQNSFYSIRINNQWRIIFKWTTKGATEVEITDYH